MTTLKGQGVVWASMIACGLSVAIATPFMTPIVQAKEPKESKKSKVPTEPIEIFADLQVPLTLQLKTLDATWKRLKFSKNESENSNYSYFGFFSIFQSALRTDVYYTQGKTVTINQQQYLVVYRPEGIEISLTDLMKSSKSEDIESLRKELTPESNLVLSLINLSSFDSLQDIQTFNLQQEIDESKPKDKEEVTPPSSPSPQPSPALE
jgi:signal peptidase I